MVSAHPLPNLMKRRFAKGALWLFLLTFAMHQSCTFVIRDPAFSPPLRQTTTGLYRGVYHVHSSYSHDSRTPLELILKTADEAGLDFIVITDHNNMNGREHAETVSSAGAPLLIFGDEISTWYDGHLGSIGIDTEPQDVGNTQEIVDSIHAQGGFAIPAHPLSKRKPWINWAIQNFDGLEVFCFSDLFYAEGLTFVLKAIFMDPARFLSSVLNTPTENLKLWDRQLLTGRRVAAFGAVDSHIKVWWQEFYAENLLLHFQAVTMYVHANAGEAGAITDALGRGHSFIAFEIRGLANSFRFTARQGEKEFNMGDALTEGVPIEFSVSVPKTADIRFIHNGNLAQQFSGTQTSFKSRGRGYYRIEAYQGGKIWIISNPIYVN